MSKSKARFLAELLGADGTVKEDKSALDISGGKITLSELPEIPNSQLAHSSITLNGGEVSLGGSHNLDLQDIVDISNISNTHIKLQDNAWYWTQFSAETDQVRFNANNLGGLDIYNQTQTEFAQVRLGSIRFSSAGEFINSAKVTNWDTAYGWGNHSTEGYLTEATLAAGVGNITTSGYLRGPATFTIDPAAHGDDTGKVVIAGDLQVDGTTTTINSTTVAIDDKNIVLADNAADASEANGAGITINGADASITYNSANDRLILNKKIEGSEGLVTNNISASNINLGANPAFDWSSNNITLKSRDAIGVVKLAGNGTYNTRLDITNPANDTTVGTIDPNASSFLNGDFNLATGSLKVGGTTVIDSSRNISGVQLELTGSAIIWTNNDNGLVLRQGQSGHPWNYIEFRNSTNDRNWYAGTDTGGNFTIVGETGAIGSVYTNKYFNADQGFKIGGTTVIDSSRNGSFNELTVNGNGSEINFTGGNNRIKFSGNRAIEGATDGSNLQIGEQYVETNIYSHCNLTSGHDYRINGTTVIDSSRNLLNITSLKGTGSIYVVPNVSNETYKSLILEESGAYGNGTVVIRPGSTPGSGTANQTLHLKSNVATGTTRHSLRVDGYITSASQLQVQASNAGSNQVVKLTGNAQSAGEYTSILISSTNFAGEWYGSEIRNVNTGSNPGYLQPKLSFFTQNNNTYLPADRTEKMSISGNGNVDITVGNLTVNGSITAGGNVTAYSDRRLKDNIKTLDGSKVYEMRGVSFTKDGEHGSGVIAQELEQIAPELVMTNDDEMQTKSVAYGNVVGYLIEAIKELKAEIEELKNGTTD